jgi:transposase
MASNRRRKASAVEADLLNYIAELIGPEKELLSFIAEQSAVKISQLCDFADLPREAMLDLVAKMEEIRLVKAKQFFTGGETWVWLKKAGRQVAKFCQVARYEVHYRSLAHWGAITDGRLWMEEHYEIRRWICERELRRGWKRKPKRDLPDAAARVMIEQKGVKKEYLIAIEAQLSRSPGVAEKVRNYPAKYQGVIYFAVPKVRRFIEGLTEGRQDPRLFIREIPVIDRRLNQPAWYVPGDRRPGKVRYRTAPMHPPLSEGELDVLDFIVDQSAVPMDQLMRFLGLGWEDEEDKERASALASRLVRGGLLHRAKPLVDEPIWLWLSQAGVAASRRDLGPLYPQVSGLEFWRALTEVRLDLTKDRDDIEWVSSRVLRRGKGTAGSLPHALVKVGSKRVAVELLLGTQSVAGLAARWERRRKEYDGVLWFYTRRCKGSARAFAAEAGSEKLGVYPLPNGPFLDVAPDVKHRKMFCGRPDSQFWYRQTWRPPVVVRPCLVEELPSAAVQKLTEAVSGPQGLEIKAVWRPAVGTKVFCVETNAGLYRLAHSKHGWSAKRVVDESIFTKETTRFVEVVTEARERQKAGLPVRYEVDGELLAELELLIPKRTNGPGTGKARLSDQAALSGLIFILRNKIGWKRLPRELGFGSGPSCQRRCREWEKLEVWDTIVGVLTERLPDGRQLDWSRLKHGAKPSAK